MAFRKRNVAVGLNQNPPGSNSAPTTIPSSGIRPSSLRSQPVTSTGTESLDDILGGHSGLSLGSSLLVEESGTTDFSGALLRYYAAEGILHGHVIHLVGPGQAWTDAWIRELPGVVEEKSSRKAEPVAGDDEKMRIAWRYEKLGKAGERVLPNRSAALPANDLRSSKPFCHSFDLTKRLVIPPDAKINHISIAPTSRPLDSVIKSLSRSLQSSPAHTIHRLVVPTILSPALWPPNTARPEIFLQFLHSLRSLLHEYSNSFTCMLTLPLELYPRTSGLVRWAEILSDGVLELTPFPHLMDASNSLVESGGARGNDEQPQGMLKVHKLPVNTERGEGGAGAGNSMGDDLAFTVSRRHFKIKPFSLPPVEGDQEAQQEAGQITKKDVEF
ncbi:Hypothetical protein R9X50_00166700 [Acrodontium crateriforme]|uniref:Elongator complex protein 4 n=1 Tax=Acrodontium crateriforme TaxID=150365 RepID=A0AAQ3LZQ8_9PEZI|nr:Hypothetical protein R9X50_00166700 [Acrodontium crateriforme]